MEDWKKSFDRLPNNYKSKIITVLEKLLVNDLSELDIKALQGYSKNSYRCRVGKYRILFTINNGNIEIFGFGPRGDIYK